MLTSMVVTVLAVIFSVLFLLYKRNVFAGKLPLQTELSSNRFQQELEQTADMVISRMEARIAHLEELLQLADEKIARLENQIQQIQGLEQQELIVYDGNTSVRQANFKSVVLPPEMPEVVGNANHGNTSRVAEGEDRRKLVIAMAEQGYNITEIAKATGRGKGEIMLLLQLNKK